MHQPLCYFKTALIVASFLFTLEEGWCEGEALYGDTLSGTSLRQKRSGQDSSSAGCTSQFQQLQSAVLEDAENNQRLINTFFPNQSPSPHLVWVFYHFNTSSVSTALRSSLVCSPSDIPAYNPSMNASNIEDYLSSVADYTYMVADQPLLIILEFELLIGLTVFDLAGVGSGACIHLIIDPFCDTIDNKTADTLLIMLSSWVSHS